MQGLLFSAILCAALSLAKSELSADFKEKFMAKMESVGEKCAAETGAPQEDIAKIITKEIPTTHEGRCMLFCGHREFHIQKPDGSVDVDSAVASLETIKAEDEDIYNKLVQVYKTCAQVPVIADPCEYAVALSECGVHEAHKLGIDSRILE
uniref:Odorant binding protein 14 n=1 Tax=Harmonia axyridis TaxID=115357 RepID=A0A8J9RUK3_HARAX|nr:odorant binding protein 14 [Harmonia axyridis]QTE76113.1 odorant binding protein 5 [Harmonia axyridis]